MSSPVLDLYDQYNEGGMNRQAFLKKLALLAGGTAAAYALLPLLENTAAHAEVAQKEEPTMQTGYIEYPGATGKVRAYMARTDGDEKRPGAIVIHENRGLNPHIEDVARRMAMEGFVAIAPDALSPLGGTPEDVDKARSLIGELDGDSTVQNFVAAVKYLKTHPQSTGMVGCMGFCWGGGMSNQLAVHSADLAAAVPFYGRQAAAEDVPKIKASLLLHYGGLDERINKGIPEYEAALKKASVDYALYIYEGAAHAFFNDTNPDRYHPEAAQLAWKRTILFLKEKLKT